MISRKIIIIMIVELRNMAAQRGNAPRTTKSGQLLLFILYTPLDAYTRICVWICPERVQSNSLKKLIRGGFFFSIKNHFHCTISCFVNRKWENVGRSPYIYIYIYLQLYNIMYYTHICIWCTHTFYTCEDLPPLMSLLCDLSLYYFPCWPCRITRPSPRMHAETTPDDHEDCSVPL